MMLSKAETKILLEMASRYEWSLQGLGMLRLRLADGSRLHVWDSHPPHRVDDVSDIHTHPWNFRSTVLAGEVHQERYVETAEPTSRESALYYAATIRCGEGGGLEGDHQQVYLTPQRTEKYKEGQSYSQQAHEIHMSGPLDGTVTLVERQFLPDTEHARVFWPFGTSWVSAHPRPATLPEVLAITRLALERWF